MSLLKLVRAPFLAAAIALLGTLGAAQPALAQASAPEASSAPAAAVAPVAVKNSGEEELLLNKNGTIGS